MHRSEYSGGTDQEAEYLLIQGPNLVYSLRDPGDLQKEPII